MKEEILCLPIRQVGCPDQRSKPVSCPYGISGGKCSIPSYHRYGRIATAEDALEFIMAGATAVSVGTANFFNPYATVEIADGIQAFLEKQKVEDINELIGVVK